MTSAKLAWFLPSTEPSVYARTVDESVGDRFSGGFFDTALTETIESISHGGSSGR